MFSTEDTKLYMAGVFSQGRWCRNGFHPTTVEKRTYGTNTDLEERKRAEEVVRANEQSLRLIVDSIPWPNCRHDRGR